MSDKTESTMKWKLDIKELKANIVDAKRQISLANAEFKQATAGAKNWASSLTGVEAKTQQLSKRLEAQKTVLSELEKEYKITADATGENSTESQKLAVQIENQKASIASTERQLGEYNDKAEEMRRAQKESESAMSQLNSEIDEQESKLAALKKAYAESVLTTGKNSEKSKELAKQISKLSTELQENKNKLNSAEDAANKFDRSLDDVHDSARDAGDGFTVMKGALSNLLAQGIQRVADGLIDLGRKTFEAGSNFEASMSNVQAISGATGGEMEKLKNKAEEMGAKTKFSATEAGDAMGYMAMAGWKTSDMLNGIEGIMNLAAASGEDLATTSDIVTDALTAMGYSAGDAGELADVMAAASSNANTNVKMMGETFQYAAPIVGALGYNMQDTAVAIGLMANAGIKGEKAGTALRSILTRLSAPPAECAAAMDELGISLTDSEGNMKSLNEVMEDLRGAFSGLSETQQTQYAKSIAGQEAMSGLLAIVNASPKDFEKLTKAVKDSNGAAQEMADTMNNNVSGQITLLKSKIEGIMIKVFEKASGSITKAIEGISESLDSVDWDGFAASAGRIAGAVAEMFSFIIKHGPMVLTVLSGIATAFVTYKAVAGITAVISTFQTFFSVLKAGQGVMAALNVTMAMNPIGLIAAAIAGLVIAFITLWNTSEGFRNFWIGLWNGIKSIVSGVVDALVGFFTETIPDALNSMIQWFSDLPGNISEFLGNALNSISEWASNLGQKAVEAGSNFLNNVVSFFANLPENLGAWLGTALGTITSWVINLGQSAINAGSTFLNNIISFFANLPGNVSTWLQNTISNVSTWAGNMAAKAREAGTNFLNNVVNFIKNLPSNVWAWLQSTISRASQFASNLAAKGSQAARNMANNLINGIKSLPSRFSSIGRDIVRGIWSGISGMGGWLRDQITSFGRNVVNSFKKALKIGSPSKVMRDEIGKWLPEGIAVGFENQMPKSFAKIQKSLNMAVDDLNADVNGGMIGAVNGMSAGGERVQNVTFNQTINSPKAVSRLDLYRETNSLLFSAKVGLANV